MLRFALPPARLSRHYERTTDQCEQGFCDVEADSQVFGGQRAPIIVAGKSHDLDT
jgi:hypothetical protein